MKLVFDLECQIPTAKWTITRETATGGWNEFFLRLEVPRKDRDDFDYKVKIASLDNVDIGAGIVNLYKTYVQNERTYALIQTGSIDLEVW